MPIFEKNGSTLTIKEEFERGSTSGKSPVWNLTVPDGLEISYASGSGSITAENLEVELEAAAGSGRG